ncbi:MAG: riboflavin synthase, partial [Candidatus Levyibacteriota bacterium]
MFTGIIRYIGQFSKKDNSQITFMADRSFCKKIAKGTSIAVNGVCLTALEKAKEKYFVVEVMPETLKKTMLADLQTNTLVNLELPVTPNTFLSGHIVQGHVDGTGTIQSIKEERNSKIITIAVNQTLSKYMV